MKLLLMAILLSVPGLAFAQTSVISEDPNPKSQLCHNPTNALHHNGDVVSVDYWGQWREVNGKQVQNGGKDYDSCETEALVRTNKEGQVVWAVEADYTTEAGFSRLERITSIAALPNGNTVILAKEGIQDDHQHVRLVMYDAAGNIVWTQQSKIAPKFAGGRILANDKYVYVSFSLTNYGYEGGKFQMPGGKVHRLKKNQHKVVLTQFSATTGEQVWERPNLEAVGLRSGELLAIRGQYSKAGSSFGIYRLDHFGKQLGRSKTAVFKNEHNRSMVWWNDKLLMTTYFNEVQDNRVKQRIGKLRVFDVQTGKVTHTRLLSDRAVLSQAVSGSQVFVVSPSNCIRGLEKYSCVSDGVDVLELSSPTDAGTYTKVELPEIKLQNRSLWAANIGDQLWYGSIGYAGDKDTPGTLTFHTHSRADEREPGEFSRYVWYPVPAKAKPKRTPDVFF